MAQSPLFDWTFDIVSRCRDVFLRSGKWFRFCFGSVSWIGRKLSDNAALSLEVGVPIVKDYPVYDFKTEVRLNVTW
jgi:hypothetical protein